MKPFFPFLLFLFLCTVSSHAQTCFNDPPSSPTVGNPIVTLSCESNLFKILARPVRASSLYNLNWFYNPGGCPTTSNGDFCHANFAQCGSAVYCPDKYCEQVNFYAEMNASIILNAFGPWGGLQWLEPTGNNADLWTTMQNIPKDINAAYDLAGLRRPVIQAGIYENIPGNITLNNIDIPPYVISDFAANDPDFSSVANIYNTGGTVSFDTDNIIRDDITDVQKLRWDANKIEARMWVYYLATSYINNGYTALHMGDIHAWGKIDRNLNDYAKTALLVDMIRAYAAPKKILLAAENPRNDTYPEGSNGGLFDPTFIGDPNYPGAKKLIFDFDNVAMRLQEKGDIDCGDINYFDNYGFTECDDQNLMAYIDPCTIDTRRTLEGGINSTGCFFETVPYVGAFDFSCYHTGSGCGDSSENPGCHLSTNLPINPSDGYIYHCWSDMGWFGSVLQEPCKSDWLKKTICGLNSHTNGFGNISIPTSILSPNTVGFYFFSEENQPVIDAVKEAWQETTPLDFSYTQDCKKDVVYTRFCNGYELPERYELIFEKSDRIYTFKVENPDCVSEYSWHIKGPNGWEPINYGTTLTFTPPVNGEYKVGIKQDNSALPGQVSVENHLIYLEAHCCNLAQKRDKIHFENISNVEVFPSPFQTYINIKFALEEASTINIQLYNLVGIKQEELLPRKKLSKGGHQEVFNLSNIHDGYYYLKITDMSNNSFKTIPLVKNNGGISN